LLPEPDPYKVLQVDPCADEVVVRAAYRTLARRFHPDGREPDPARMAALNRAYATIRDPEVRRWHDRSRVDTSSTARSAPATSPPRLDPWRRGAEAAPEGATPGILDFGRYAGWRLADIARHDPDYLRWLSRHSAGIRFREQIARLLPREPDLGRRANAIA
jgi:curved DNA-binding protein CbpA